MFSTSWPKFLIPTSFAILGLLTSGCTAKKGGPPSFGPAEVAVITVQPESLVLTTELPGRTTAFLTAEIRPQVNGIIKDRAFKEGAFVHAGDLLYKIDPAPYEAAFGQAKATLATAEAELANAEANLTTLKLKADRYRDLVGVHAVGQQDYDDANAAFLQAQAVVNSRKASVEAGRATLETARINLAYTPIKAPISGRIGKSNVTVGALTTSYQATSLATIQQIDPLYVDVVQANADTLRLRRSLESGGLKSNGSGQNKVKLILEDGSTYPIQGILQFRDFTVDTSTGAVILRIVFPNPKEVLLPGMFVRAIVDEGVKSDAILVPQQSVLRDPKGMPYALVVGQDNKVERRAVELDRAIGTRWLVSSGLKGNDRLIVEGGDKTREGAQVRAVPYQGNAAPAGQGQPAQQQNVKADGHV